ncbi:PIF1 [Mytilus coruscus]|uniref:PIF1 n=1 Tax=Mytilus coruscus TaxID=42192 RepID=A0A6J8C2M4_MYTCO|nr:PIF1 [Mytilus coruscus]
MDLPGDYTVYNSIDEGQISKLDKSPVTKQLHLKIGCPVMLLKNLNEKLVNGLRGIVSSLSSKCVTINFTGLNGEILTANLKTETFLVFSCNENRVIASRQQIPICLAYSITIHKALGLTLQRVEVDASNIFAPGQLGVAIGRATEKKGLRVIGFNRSSVLKHEASLYQFYDASNNNEFDNSGKLTCCKIVFNNTEGNSVDTIENSNLDDELSDFSDGEIEEIDFLLSKDTDITEPCEPDQIQELFIDLTEIPALFSDLNTAPIDKSFNLYGAGILNYTHGELLKNKPLFELWKNLFCDFEIVDSIFMVCSQDSEQCLIELYTDVVLRFCRISDNEFRKGILRQFGKTKTERLRKKVDSKVSTSGTLTMKNIYGDNSQGKVSSHLKLKSLVFDSSKSAFSNFVKNDLLKLCHAYAIQIATNSTNDKIKDKLCSVLSSALEIPFPEYLNESGPKKSPTDQTLDSTQTIAQSVPDVSDVQVPSTSGQSEVTIKAKPKLKRKRKRSKLVTKTKKRKNNNENSGEKDTILSFMSTNIC